MRPQGEDKGMTINKMRMVAMVGGVSGHSDDDDDCCGSTSYDHGDVDDEDDNGGKYCGVVVCVGSMPVVATKKKR